MRLRQDRLQIAWLLLLFVLPVFIAMGAHRLHTSREGFRQGLDRASKVITHALHLPLRPTVNHSQTRVRHHLKGDPGQHLAPSSRPQEHTVAAPSSKCQSRSMTAIDASSVPASTKQALADYICKGPLLANCGLKPEDVMNNIDAWVSLGHQLAVQLKFNPDALDEVQMNRIYHYYLPVYLWCDAQLTAHRATGSKQALVIGISAPQGCGKTTLVEQLEALFTNTGRQAAAVSVDDFYLTNKDQVALATSNPGNPLLQYRGNAGTHDLQLGTATLQSLRALTVAGQQAAIPRYDKSAFGGRGDRAAESTWPKVQGPLEVLLFEGWMSGFRPLEQDQQAEAVSPGLGAVNAALRSYHQAWDALVDSWLVIRIGDPQWVYKWRLQAEEMMRASGKTGMTDEQIADFVARFQPAYKAYLPGLYTQGPTSAKPGHTLVIEVEQSRKPVEQQPAPVL